MAVLVWGGVGVKIDYYNIGCFRSKSTGLISDIMAAQNLSTPLKAVLPSYWATLGSIYCPDLSGLKLVACELTGRPFVPESQLHSAMSSAFYIAAVAKVPLTL